MPMLLLFVAMKLLEGRGCQVTSNNPETMRQFRALAAHIGATVGEESGWFDLLKQPSLVAEPPGHR